MNKKLIIAFIVFALIGVGVFYLLTTGNVGAKFNTAEVIAGQVGKYVEDVGRISSKDVRRYYGLGVKKIVSMDLKLGDHVEKGQLLIQYEDRLDIEVQKVKKQIESLEATYKDAQSGADVESISNARIEVSRIESDLEWAQQEKARTENLYNSGAASLNEYELAIKELAALQKDLETAENAYDLLAKKMSQTLREKYEADIEVLVLTLQSLEKERADASVFADIDGIVTEIGAFEGETPSLGSLVIEIQDPAQKIILVDFMVEDARQIKPGMTGEILDYTLDLHIEDLKVDMIYPKAFVTLSELSVEENRQTVEISLPDSTESLAYGLEVQTRVMVEPSRETLLIPVGAVYYKNSKPYVKVLVDGATTEKEIVTGTKDDGSIEVKEGLAEGEQVILNYQEEAAD